MRWSDRQPLKRDEGMATNQGTTLKIQPWRENRLLRLRVTLGRIYDHLTNHLCLDKEQPILEEMIC